MKSIWDKLKKINKNKKIIFLDEKQKIINKDNVIIGDIE